MRRLVVTGTDTDVGKTTIVAALAAVARAGGEQVAVVKPVQTGVEPGEPGDLDTVRRLSGVDDLHELVRLADPLAPASAARRAGIHLPSVAEVARAVKRLEGRELVLVEGAGGLLVDLDGRGGTVIDLAVELAAPVLVVVRAGLGTLNHTALTCEVLRIHGVECQGIVIGAWPAAPDLAACSNLKDLPSYAGRRLVGRMPEGAGELGPGAFLLAAQEHLIQEVFA